MTDPRTRLADSLAWQCYLFAFVEKVARIEPTGRAGSDSDTLASLKEEAAALIALERRDGVRG